MVQLKASSLMEVIVSSIIMLIIFMLSVEIITKIALNKDEEVQILEAVNQMKQLIDTTSQEQMIDYEWGVVEVTVTTLSNNLIEVSLNATIVKSRKQCQLKKIVIK